MKVIKLGYPKVVPHTPEEWLAALEAELRKSLADASIEELEMMREHITDDPKPEDAAAMLAETGMTPEMMRAMILRVADELEAEKQ